MSETGHEIVRPHWNATTAPHVRPHDVVRFADLAGVQFAGTDLRGVTFFGCRLNGASFVGAAVAETEFVGCFASEQGEPVLFGPRRPRLLHSHLGDEDGGSGWPVPVAEAARVAVSGNNAERYHAVLDLGTSAYRPAGPFLVSMLDDEEWDVRSAAVQALTELRGDGFPDDDDAVLRATFEALGDENSLVAMRATEFVEATGAPRGPIEHVLALTRSAEPEQILIGLRATVALSRIDDLEDTVAQLFDGRSLLHLLASDLPVVRAEYLHALGAVNLNVPQAWQAGLRDSDPGVRTLALAGLRLLDEPPSVRIVEPLLQDPVEGVRIEALFTLGQLGDFDRALVRTALNDPAEQVRHYAALLLDR